MIILDTNVISAFTREKIDRRAFEWLNQYDDDSAWTTSVNVMEAEYGVFKMKDETIQSDLSRRTERFLREIINGRVLVFDISAARFAARVRAENESRGRTIEFRDLINPWDPQE